MSRNRRVLGAPATLLLLAAPCACESDQTPVVPADLGAAGPHAAPSARPPDRLAPGELAPGTAQAFGLVLPRDLRVQAQFQKELQATGPVSPEAVANYVRQRVVAAHVELGVARTVFPDALIKGGPAGHVFQIEILPERGGRTRLIVRDVTPEPATQGLTEEERWRRAGLTPDGKLLEDH